MTAQPPSFGVDPKADLRRGVLVRRRAAHKERGPDAANRVAAEVLKQIPPAGKKIAGYWPIGDELDCRPTLTKLAEAGAEIALPVVAGQGHALVFRAWHPGDALDSGPFGTAHPSPRAAVITPDILLLPLVAFDATGHRLGYGAGYYDRTVDGLRGQHNILAVGVGYDEQEIPAVPANEYDQRMDGIITDRRVIWLRKP